MKRERAKSLEWGAFFSQEAPASLKLAASYAFLERVFKSKDRLISRVKKGNARAIRYNELFGAKIYFEDELYIHFEFLAKHFKSLNSSIIKRLAKPANADFASLDEFLKG